MWPLTRSKSKSTARPTGSWKDHELWFVDGEMTGLDLKKDELLHLVAMPMREGRLYLSEMKQWLIQPQRPLGEGDAVCHHHITPRLLRDAVSVDRFATEVEQVLRGKVVVGHHVGIDLSFISKLARFENYSLDTAKLFRSHQTKTQPHFPPEHLELLRVAESLEVPAWPSHFALNDVLTCANCFLKMAHELEVMGINDIEQLLKLG